VELELSNQQRLEEWQKFYQSQKEIPPGQNLYQCGAGVSAFYIDPYGNLRPCLMVTDLSQNVVHKGFSESWREVMVKLSDRKPAKNNPCHQCHDRVFCGYCPAYNRIENMDEEVPSDFLCQIGRLRSERVRI
jgi:radical SAM protein with 4Fe4S-binding SPASM domain